MKYMTMGSKGYVLDLQMFADGGDGGPDGDDAGDDGDDQDADSDEDGEEEKKFSQKDVDEAIKKRLAREKKKWGRKQEAPPKDDAGNSADESEEVKARKAAEVKASNLEVKVACFEAGVSKDAVDDVTALARAYMAADDDLDLDDAIGKVVKKYPQFKKVSADPYEEDDEGNKGKAWGQRQKGGGSKKTDGVEAAFLKRNPGLKV